MKYIDYIKHERLLEGLNSARQKFNGTEDEFEALKDLDPTANSKWKYMDFIVKVGYHDDLKELLKNFEQLSNKGIIKNKDINSYSYQSLKNTIEQDKTVTTKRQRKVEIKKDSIKVSNDPLVVIPLSEKASIYYGKGTKWCTAATESKNYFNNYFFEEDKTLLYILTKRKWAVVINKDGSLNSCWNDLNTIISIKNITDATGVTFENCLKWANKHKKQINNIKLLNDLVLFRNIHKNDIEKIKEIIKIRKDINIADKNNETPLYWACYKDNIEIVRLLLNNGAQKSVNIVNRNNKTPLYWACCNNNMGIIRLLLEYGAQESVNIANDYGKTPLYWACYENDIEIVKLLLEYGAQESVNITDSYNKTPLCWACYRNNMEMARLLLEYGAQESVNIADDYSRTPLYQACCRNNTEIVRLLLDNGAQESVNIADDYSRTPLYWAKKRNNQEIINLLIKYGATE